MLIDFINGQAGVTLRVKVRNSSVSTGAGLTGLSLSSVGLVISTIADNEATPTTYTQSGGTIESISTLGTFVTPTANKCRFRELDSVNHKGVYELQIDNSRFSIAGAKSLLISISGSIGVAECDVVIPLRGIDPYSLLSDSAFSVPTESAGRPAGVLSMMRRVFEWSTNKRIRDRSSGVVALRNSGDTGDLESQTQSTSGNVDTQTKGV